MAIHTDIISINPSTLIGTLADTYFVLDVGGYSEGVIYYKNITPVTVAVNQVSFFTSNDSGEEDGIMYGDRNTAINFYPCGLTLNNGSTVKSVWGVGDGIINFTALFFTFKKIGKYIKVSFDQTKGELPEKILVYLNKKVLY